MATLLAVPAAEFAKFRHLVWPFLEKMAVGSHGRFAPEDLETGILERSMQLWLSIDGTDILAAGLTQIIAYPQRKSCRWIAMVGRNYREWLREHDEVEKWARACGCTEMQAEVGQKAWVRILGFLGYGHDHVLLRKDL